MYSTLKIECIGAVPNPKHIAIDRMFGGALGFAACYKKRWWVAEITGTCEKYGLKRDFISQRRDSSLSNSVGSRGVYANYMLHYGKMYEISSPQSWRKDDRYFVLGDNVEERLTKEEVITWLKSR